MRELLILLVAVAVICGGASLLLKPSQMAEEEVRRAHESAAAMADPEPDLYPPAPAMPTLPGPLDEAIEPTTGRPWSEIMNRTR